MNFVVQAAEPRAQLFANSRVQGAEGFVEEQHLGLRCERSRQGNPLPLTSRELRRVAVSVACHLNQLEQLVNPVSNLPAGKPLDFETERDILPHAHVAKEGVVLKDKADAPILDRQMGCVLSRQLDLPRVGCLQPGDDPQDGTLARARGTQERQ